MCSLLRLRGLSAPQGRVYALSLSLSCGFFFVTLTSNAGRQAPPIAAAQRRLLAVACTPLFGWGRLVGLWVACPLFGPPACPCARLLEHLVRQHEEVRGYRDPKRFGGLEVNGQVILHGLLYGQIGRRGTA